MIFPEGWGSEKRACLAPLLQWRREQVKEPLYREYSYLKGQSAFDFLVAEDASIHLVDPKRMPYYLLIVGGPEEIPFSFQYHLDIQYAVGRVCFSKLEDYTRYAEKVVAREEKTSSIPRVEALFAAPTHADDRPTTHSRALLNEDLIQRWKQQRSGLKKRADLQMKIRTVEGKRATKSEIIRQFKEHKPNFFFSASHALAFPKGHADQERLQGSPIYGEWPGPGVLPEPRHYLTEEDLASIDLSNMIWFLFGCFTGGTPKFTDFPPAPNQSAEQLAEGSFVAGLPRQLLARSDGPLAVVGHVDGSFAWSFSGGNAADDPRMRQQTEMYQSFIYNLFTGSTLGVAMEVFHDAFATRWIYFQAQQKKASHPVLSADPDELRRLWYSVNDTRNFIILGDPAVRLFDQE